MTQVAFPFDNALAYEAQWTKMARKWLNTGILKSELNEYATFADSTGMQVKVPSGRAWLEGHFHENDAQLALAIAAADPTNPRIDRVVLHLDWTNNLIDLRVLTGTPAVSPSAPAITQNSTIWEISLATVAVAAAAATIAAGNVTDTRAFVQNVDINATQTLTNKALTSPTMTSPTITSGNLNFSGTGQRITGDMSNAVQSNRLLIQNSVLNGATNFGIIPNGTSTTSQISLYNTSDAANAGILRLFVSGTTSTIGSSSQGTGSIPTTLAHTGYTSYTFDAAVTMAAALAVNATGSVFSAGNADTAVSIGNGSSGVSAAAQLFLKAPSTNTATLGGATVIYQRAATPIWHTGIDGVASSGAKSSATDFFFYNNSAYVAALSTGGVWTTTGQMKSLAGGGNPGFVNAPSANTDAAYISFSNGGGDFYIGRNNSTGSSLGSGSGAYSAIVRWEGATALSFSNAGSERMRIDSSGNFHIGSAAGAASSTSVGPTAVSTSYPGVRLLGTSGTVIGEISPRTDIPTLLIGTTSNHTVSLFTSNTIRAVLTAGGLFEVGGAAVSTGLSRVQIADGGNNSKLLFRNSGASAGNQNFDFYQDGTTLYMRIPTDNFSGATTAYALVRSTTSVSSHTWYVGSSTLALTIDSSGNVNQPGGNHSYGSLPATIGLIRVPNATAMSWRNGANTNNFQVYHDSSDNHNFGYTPDGDSALANGYLFNLKAAAAVGFQMRTISGGLPVRGVTYLNGLSVFNGASGTDNGAGTVTVSSNMFKGTTAYTNPDFVFEAAFTGKVERYVNNSAYAFYRERYKSAFPTLLEMRDAIRETWRFPLINDERMGLFTDEYNLGRDDVSLILHEQAFVYLWQHEDRITTAETRIEQLERENRELRELITAKGN